MIKPPAEIADAADFRSCLQLGWEPVDTRLFRADGVRAHLRFPRPAGEGRERMLLVKCHPVARRTDSGCRMVEVVINDLSIALWAVQCDQTFAALVPAPLWDGYEDVAVTLKIAALPAPQDDAKADEPVLGLLLEDAKLVPATDALTELGWLGTGGDPIGRVFSRNGFAWRAIFNGSVATVKALDECGVYRTLAERGLVPDCAFMDITHDRFGMVGRTRSAVWPVVPADYCLGALRDAALTWLGINDFLLERNSETFTQLIDGHGGNFALFEGSRPRWVDLGSIGVPQDLFGHAQFVRCFLYPLLVVHRFPDKITNVRQMLTQGDGLSIDDMRDLGAADEAVAWSQELSRTPLERVAVRTLLKRLREALDTVNVDHVKNFWSTYRVPEELDAAWQGHYAPNHPDTRFRTVASLATGLQASTFIDIGSNDGIFSLLCAREGMAGLALDTDEASMNKLYRFLGQQPDARVTVAYGAFPAIAYEAELVLCLALTHHLTLSQGMDFETIACKLASLCTRALITEFMPDGLGGTSDIRGPYPNPLPAAYSLEAFLAAHRQYFRKVTVIDYLRESAPSRRVLVLCEYPRR